MDARTIHRIKHKLSTRDVQRHLVKYFVEHGFIDSFDRLMYPAQVIDITKSIPQLSNKIDVEPHAVDIDPMTNMATLGWNLFVLGSHRMFLGETKHVNLKQLASDLKQGKVSTEGVAVKQTTPRKIINFVTHVLDRSENGYVDPNLIPRQIQQPRLASGMVSGMSPKFMGASGR